MDRYKLINGIYVYFVTFTVTEWLPVFVKPEPIEIFLNSMIFCINHKELRINSFVIMPNHIHIILFNAHFDNNQLQKSITDLRKFTGNKLADYIDNNHLTSFAAIIRSKKIGDRIRQFWQPSWHAEGIVTEQFLKQKMDYIHMNPVRKGLVSEPEDWALSSAAYWLLGKSCKIPLTPIEFEDKK